jgi:triacylglycerol esterase/lipase EstA (alpha/beta hydrolase family)
MKCIQIFLHTALIFLIIGSSYSLAAEPMDKTEAVVLLQYNYDYESRKNEISTMVDDLQEFLGSCCQGKGTSLHFVTHSLGGILVRALIAGKRPDNLGRVVMLSPPNKGSEVADYIKDYSSFKDILGPASMQLGTGLDSMPNRLGPADFELGVITGNRTIDPLPLRRQSLRV